MVLGGADTTGVFVLVESLLWQELNKNKPQSARKMITVLDVFVAVILDWISLILFVGERFTGHSILTFNPPAEIDKLAAFRTEGTKRIVFPLGRLRAGWAFHDLEPRERPTSERCRSFNQYSSFDECDRTFAAHGIQADGDALTSGADNGGYFAVGQGDIDEHTLGFRYPITQGKISQKAIETGRNGVQCKIGEPALRVIKSLTDQAESVIMKTAILSHPPFEIPHLNSQEPGIFVGDCRVRALPRSGIKR